MSDLYIGVGEIDLIFRHARTFKDKRHVMQSIINKLRKMGFSVTECGFQEDMKNGSIGLSYAGHSHRMVKLELDEVDKLLFGDFKVAKYDKDIFNYSETDTEGYRDNGDEEEPWDKS